MLHVHLPNWARLSTDDAKLCLDPPATFFLLFLCFHFRRARIYTYDCTLTMYLEALSHTNVVLGHRSVL